MPLPPWLGPLRRLFPDRRPPALPPAVGLGVRVRLRVPMGSPHKVWIPAGATGIVVGWDAPARQVSIELDMPRTLVTVPWSWVEAEPPPTPGA